MSSPCKIEGCDRQGPLSRGMCRTHYMRWWSRGDAGGGAIGVYGRTECQVPECDRAHFTHGYCALHYKRWKANGDPLVIGNVGEAHHLWAGSDVGYSGLHDRLRRTRGPASVHACQHCAGKADDWAYDHADLDECHDGPSGLVYSADLDHYIPLCKSCHKSFDVQHRVAVG